MSYHLKFFSVVYSLALTLLMTVFIFGFNLTGFVLLPTLIACALLSAAHFVQSESRTPNKEEKVQMIWGSSAVALCMTTFFVFILILLNPNAEQILEHAENAGILIVALTMLVLIVLHAAVFYIAYTWYAEHRLKKQIKRNTGF